MIDFLHTLPISPYWLFRILAIVFALVFAIIKRKAFNLKLPDVFIATAFTVAGAIVGAKGLYAIGQVVMHGGDAYFWTWENWSQILRAGGPLFGSVLGAIGMLWLFSKVFKHKLIDMLGLAAIIFFGANFLTRLGCFSLGAVMA